MKCFELDDEQFDRYDTFRVNHECEYRVNRQFTFQFKPNGFCTEVLVKCSCGREIDLTPDVSVW